ncbi:MAG TPA: isoprenylcysteine carboxylmethyltransferase family protein [Pseudolysinimonas sp.]|jgi:methyltransferase
MGGVVGSAGPIPLSVILFTVLILLTGVERIVETVISARNARWAFERGGMETNKGQLPWMIALHVGMLLGALAEVWLLGRPFLPLLGWPMLLIALACQAGRYWVIRSLGHQWNTRIVVVPGMPLVTTGPYRWGRVPHPNYVIVVIEGAALPLVHTAWITALAFTVLNAVLLLGFRVPAEDRALAGAARIGTGVKT